MLKRHLKNSFNLLLAVAMIFTLILASVAATGVTTIEGKSSGVQVTSSSALTISPEEIELVAGGESATLTLTSTIHPTVQNAKWSSSNQSVATVNKGVVTPVSPGTAVITATISSDKSQYATCFVTVLSPSTIYYRLTYSAGTGGYVLGELSQTVNQGGSGTAVEAIPNENYHFVGWSDGRDDNPRTDANVMANVDVAANFAIDNQETYLLTLAANPKEGGTVTGGGNYAPETTVRVVAVPNSGYDFEYWTLETTPVSNSATFDYTMPASDTTLVAVFKTAESSSVMVSPTSMILTVGGEDGTIAVTQNPSHPTNRNIKWSSSNTGVATVNNGVVRAISPGVATITASNSSGSGTCQVTVNPALPKLFVVTFSDPSNGSMTASVEGALISSGSSVTEGKDILFTTVPNLGHEVSSWRVNGTVVAGETGLTYTYRNLDRNIAVEVMLKEPDLKVASVASVSTKYVDYGTPFGSVGLPSTIEATLEDGSKTNLGVTWSKGSYDENVAGTYTVEGTLTMKTGVVNPDGVKASAQIVVNEKPDLKVASVASVSTKYVDYGTPFGSV
ncbi:InlB B-repeat-containing protein, partial [Alkalibacter saccharofermentans]